MGLDVPKTNLVVLNSSPSTAWEFSQEVLVIEIPKFHESVNYRVRHLVVHLSYVDMESECSTVFQVAQLLLQSFQQPRQN